MLDEDEADEAPEAPERPRKSISGTLGSIVRWVSESVGIGNKYEKTLMANLGKSTMFKYCSQQSKLALANSMELEPFKKGDVLSVQGEPQTSAIVVVEGQVARLRLINDQLHHMASLGSSGSSATVGMMHLLREEKCFATVRALSDGACYRLQADVFRELLEESPEFAQEVIFSLTREVRSHTRSARTPLFLTSGKAMPAEPLPWFAVSCAAAIESFYRSGLNAYLNAHLSGQPLGTLFPNMHVQLPVRVLYINGFKGLRHLLDSRVQISEFESPQLAGLGLAVLPGIIMTPISSVLEACNAQMNPEPLQVRWTRGFIPRCGREVVFGIGINQLSDFFEERMELFRSQKMQNLAGSLLAGVCAGYLSHIPHNLSTLKLLMPKVSYKDHFAKLMEPKAQWFDTKLYPPMLGETQGQQRLRLALRRIAVPFVTCALPKGALLRTTQIAGSFAIINSAVNMLSSIEVNVSVSRSNQ